MTISVVMTPYQREKQLNVTLPTIIGADEIVIESDDRDHSQQAWMNPAPILNRAIAKASGDIIIQQNAECLHVNRVVDVMRKLPRGQVWFASCMALKEDGTEDKWYCHPEHRPRPDFFCGAFWKDEAPRYNEAFTQYGYEDVQWADDARKKGLTFHYFHPEEALVYHQWHPPFVGDSQSRTLYNQLKGEAIAEIPAYAMGCSCIGFGATTLPNGDQQCDRCGKVSKIMLEAHR